MVIDGGNEQVHMDGATVDHVQWTTHWSASEREDVFDAAALERAMLDARRSAYSELADLAAS